LCLVVGVEPEEPLSSLFLPTGSVEVVLLGCVEDRRL